MRMMFMVNGWRESRSYFQSVGRFTKDEWDRMVAGETITKNGNEFSIVIEEV